MKWAVSAVAFVQNNVKRKQLPLRITLHILTSLNVRAAVNVLKNVQRRLSWHISSAYQYFRVLRPPGNPGGLFSFIGQLKLRTSNAAVWSHIAYYVIILAHDFCCIMEFRRNS